MDPVPLPGPVHGGAGLPLRANIANISFNKATVERKFNGEGWYDFSYQFELMAVAAGIWDCYVTEVVQSSAIGSNEHYKRLALTSFAILNRNCTTNIQQQLKQFKSRNYPAYCA